MSKRHIHIDRLNLRLKNVTPEAARAAVQGLGPELSSRLFGPERPPGAKDLRSRIAGEISSAIRERGKMGS